MAIYEYECKDCGVLEIEQKISEPPLERCPKCGSIGGFEKLISQSSFHLKGTGWYKTDYKEKKR